MYRIIYVTTIRGGGWFARMWKSALCSCKCPPTTFSLPASCAAWAFVRSVTVLYRICELMFSFCFRSAKYELVKFRRGSIEIIPHTWKIDQTSCYYPTSCKTEEERKEKVECCIAPKPRSSFKKHKVSSVYSSGEWLHYGILLFC